MKLRRHHNIIFLLIIVVVFLDLYWFISCARYRDRDLKISSDLVEFVTAWITQSKPLVGQEMVVHMVDIAQIKLKCAKNCIFGKSSGQESDGDLSLFGLLLLDIVFLQEEMLVVSDLSKASDLVLDRGVLLLAQAGYLNHGVDGTIFWGCDLFDLLDVDVCEIVTASQLFDVGLGLSLIRLSHLDLLCSGFFFIL